MELDSIDRRLLDLLQADAKIPYAKLGRQLDISSSGVHKRVNYHPLKRVASGVGH